MLDKKKNMGQLFFHWEPNIKFQNLACRVLKIWHAQKSLTNGQTNRRTNEGKIICRINFIRNWGHNQVIYSSLPIYSSSFKAPASIAFRYFADKGNMPKFTKGHYLQNIFQNLHKS